MSLTDQYLPKQNASTEFSAGSTEETVHFPLPGGMRASSLLVQIGEGRLWTDDQIEADINVLDSNRLYYVHDLRALSSQSWTVILYNMFTSCVTLTLLGLILLRKTIELLPLVRDLLRNAVHTEWNSNDNQKKKGYMREKKMKKTKKEKKRHLNVVDNPDPETAKNTILNSVASASSGIFVDASEPISKGKRGNNSKSVSFMTAGKQVNGADSHRSISGSSSNTSSGGGGSSSESEMDNDETQCHESRLVTASSGGLPDIKPVDSTMIRVRTVSGKIFDCQRRCPHKNVDLVRYGKVQGDSLVCAKHGWHFDLTTPSTGGKTISSCEVNDW